MYSSYIFINKSVSKLLQNSYQLSNLSEAKFNTLRSQVVFCYVNFDINRVKFIIQESHHFI